MLAGRDITDQPTTAHDQSVSWEALRRGRGRGRLVWLAHPRRHGCCFVPLNERSGRGLREGEESVLKRRGCEAVVLEREALSVGDFGELWESHLWELCGISFLRTFCFFYSLDLDYLYWK